MPATPVPLGEPVEFTATVRVDSRSGVSLEREDGTHWRIDESPGDCWRPLDGLKVTATGAPQASGATRFVVEALRVVRPDEHAALVAISEEQVLTGALLTDQPLVEFQDEDGPIWPLYNPDALDDLTGPVVLTVREVELSPFAPRISGPQLCILNARSHQP